MLRKICDAYEDALKRIKHMFALLVSTLLCRIDQISLNKQKQTSLIEQESL